MSRYIDADVLRETIEFCHYFGDDGITFNASEKEVLMQIIDGAPTIEVPEWIPFEIRPTDDDEKEYFKTDAILDGNLPDVDVEVLVSKDKYVWIDTFVSDELGAWLDSYGEIEDGMAWMPLPGPWKGADDE